MLDQCPVLAAVQVYTPNKYTPQQGSYKPTLRLSSTPLYKMQAGLLSRTIDTCTNGQYTSTTPCGIPPCLLLRSYYKPCLLETSCPGSWSPCSAHMLSWLAATPACSLPYRGIPVYTCCTNPVCQQQTSVHVARSRQSQHGATPSRCDCWHCRLLVLCCCHPPAAALTPHPAEQRP